MPDERTRRAGVFCTAVSLFLFQAMLDGNTHHAPFSLLGWRVAAVFVLSLFGLSAGLGRHRTAKRISRSALGYAYCLLGAFAVMGAFRWGASLNEDSSIGVSLLLITALVVPVFGWIGRILSGPRPGRAALGYLLCAAALILALLADAFFTREISPKIISPTELMVVLVATLPLVRGRAKFVGIGLACGAAGYLVYVHGYRYVGAWFSGMTAGDAGVPWGRVLLSGPLLAAFIWGLPHLLRLGDGSR